MSEVSFVRLGLYMWRPGLGKEFRQKGSLDSQSTPATNVIGHQSSLHDDAAWHYQPMTSTMVSRPRWPTVGIKILQKWIP